MSGLEVMLIASNIAGIGLVLVFVITLVTFLVWLVFIELEVQFKRLMRSLKIQDVHQFGIEYREWKAERKKDKTNV